MDKLRLLSKTFALRRIPYSWGEYNLNLAICGVHIHSRNYSHSTRVTNKTLPQETNSLPTIPEFYANKNIFITGGTGFIGKSLIEKLLRSCPDLEGIYCLTRQKKGVNSQERIKGLFDDPVFGPLKQLQPDHTFMKKVHAVDGDGAVDDFGIDDKVKEHLYSTIDVFIHSAATTSFFEPMRVAVNMNVLGTRRAIELARRMPRLESFVQISTAYTNCDRRWKEVKEQVYEQQTHYKELIELCSTPSNGPKNDLDYLKGDYPNTYSYTKGQAEHLLMEEARDLPFCISRISVVMSSYQEPFPGWLDYGSKTQGLTSVVYNVGRGFLRGFNAVLDICLDTIPVDLTANSIIAMGWHTALFPSEDPKIYHVTSTPTNPLTWRTLERASAAIFTKYPNKKRMKSVASNWIFENNTTAKLRKLTGATLPAYPRDLWRLMTGRKPVVRRAMAGLHTRMESLEYFCINPFYFAMGNYNELLNDMTPRDQKEFLCDPAEIDWNKMVFYYCMATKHYLDLEEVNSKELEEGSKVKWTEL